MRLTQEYIDIIKDTLTHNIKDVKIFLFGSRVDNTKKGGDIDLFVTTSQNVTLKEKLEILTELEINGIKRKVDLILDTPKKSKKDFFNTIKEEALLL